MRKLQVTAFVVGVLWGLTGIVAQIYPIYRDVQSRIEIKNQEFNKRVNQIVQENQQLKKQLEENKK